VTATARKLAVLVYHVLKGDFVYHDPGAHGYDEQQRTRVLRQLRQRADRLGFALLSRETGEVSRAVASDPAGGLRSPLRRQAGSISSSLPLRLYDPQRWHSRLAIIVACRLNAKLTYADEPRLNSSIPRSPL